MGRTSNVADLVVEAAERFLREDGGRIDRITVDRCYGAVGRGSRSTISSALAGWKALVAKRVIPDKFPVREELFPLIRQLVEASDVLAKAEFAEEQKKVNAERDEAQRQRLETAQELAATTERVSLLVSQIEALKIERDAQAALHREDRARTEAEMRSATSRIDELKGELEAARMKIDTERSAAEQRYADFAADAHRKLEIAHDLHSAVDADRQVIKAHLAAVQKELAGTRGKLVEAEKLVDQLRGERDRAATEVLLARSAVQRLNATLTDVRADLARRDETNAALHIDAGKDQVRIKALEAELEAIRRVSTRPKRPGARARR